MSPKRSLQFSKSTIVEHVQSFLIACGGRSTPSRIGTAVGKVKPRKAKLMQILRKYPKYFRVEKGSSDAEFHVVLVNSPIGKIPSNYQTLSAPSTVRDSESEEEEMDESMERPSKRLKCLSLKDIIQSLEVHEMDDPNELPLIIGTISNFSNNGDDRSSVFVGIDFRRNLSGRGVPPSTLVDIIIGKSTFTFDCQTFSTVHGPHWLQALLSHQRLCPMIGNPLHLWEQPSMALDATTPLAELNTLDAQLVAEYLFHEIYLEWESILDKLVKLRFGTELLPGNSKQHHKHLFFHLLWEEMQHKLQEQDILLLQSATNSRMANIDARYQFGFDSGNGYMKYGCTLANMARAYPTHPLRPQPFLDKIPLEDSHDFNSLFECLPPRLLTYLNPWYPNIENFEQTITEIILDLGQPPYLWVDGKRVFFCNRQDSLIVEQEDIDHVLRRGQFRFGPDNRAAIVPPGSGKTTLVRDIARVLSEEAANTVIVDTSNEIGGEGEKPHPCVGLARRMMVPSLKQQASVMVECVQNHTPHVMIIDEIGRANEVAASGTIKNRGVRLVASAHGDLRGLVANADLNRLMGGVQAVTIGDGFAIQRASATACKVEKVVTQRVGTPIFDVIIELDRNNKHSWKVITEPREAVDAILNSGHYSYEQRSRNPETFEMSMVRHSDG